MSTKCIVLGQEEKKELKEIEFLGFLSNNLNIVNDENYCAYPKEYKNIELVCKNYQSTKKDLMFAYDEDRNYGYLYLGHWNDGVV